MHRSFTFFFCEICHFCLTYETKKNAKNAAFFYKECKRTQRTTHSFIKNVKVEKNVCPAQPWLKSRTHQELIFWTYITTSKFSTTCSISKIEKITLKNLAHSIQQSYTSFKDVTRSTRRYWWTRPGERRSRRRQSMWWSTWMPTGKYSYMSVGNVDPFRQDQEKAEYVDAYR